MPRARSTSTWRRISALVIAVLASVGCDRAGDSDRAAPMAEVAAPTEADQWPSPSDDACAAFGSAFERAAQEANVASMNALIDWDVILQKVVGDTQVEGDFEEDFVKGAKIGIAGANGFAGDVAKTLQQGGSYKFLRARTRGGRASAVFRQLSEGGGNYHEFLLALNPQGAVRAVDIYIYLVGDNTSTTMRRMYLPIVAEKNRSSLARLSGSDNDLVEHIAEIRDMKQGVLTGQYSQVLRIYGSLPESLRQDKSVLVIRAQAAMEVSDPEYLQALEDLRRLYPDDPCVALKSIDYFRLRKQYDRARESCDRVSEAVGGDPSMLVAKGHLYLAENNVAKAREVFDAAVAAEPTLVEAYLGSVELSLAEKDFGDTQRWLKVLRDRFQVELADPASIPGFAEFMTSPEYQAWLAEQATAQDKSKQGKSDE